MTSIAFLPLYPSSIWALSQIPFVSPILAGWIISTMALGIGLIFLYKIVKDFHPEIDPLQPIMLLLIFPTAFFLTAVYTESLFLMLSLIFFYLLFKKQFLMSAVFLSLASICRLNGLFLFIPLIYEYFRTYKLRKFINPNLLSFVIAPIGIISFMFYQFLQFNEPLAFLKSQMEWGRKFTLNTVHFQLITPSSYANLATDFLFFATALGIGILLLKKIRASYGIYVLTTILITVSTGTLMSVGRFTVILFPIFILLASIKNTYFKFGWQLLSILLLALFTAFFVNNYWAG
jgi:Gpi18-like mannosyltransferase